MASTHNAIGHHILLSFLVIFMRDGNMLPNGKTDLPSAFTTRSIPDISSSTFGAPLPVVSELRSVRNVSNKSDFSSGPFTAAVSPQLRASTSSSSDATSRAFWFGPIIKRLLDVAVAAVGLVLFSPILVLTALAIILDSKGPSICRHVRYGYGNQTYRIFTFRCAKHENIDGHVSARHRVTRIGRILRSSGIDGLPQLINVLRGEMSIVGPRPYEAPPGMTYDALLSRFSGHYKAKPGLTGWAQVNGCGNVNSLEAMRQRIEYDLYYVENSSFRFDLKIILLTMGSKKTYARAG
jgi:lipopolysaccharide/colanic/teichoic acid biosynthesis glycosyltransferase